MSRRPAVARHFAGRQAGAKPVDSDSDEEEYDSDVEEEQQQEEQRDGLQVSAVTIPKGEQPPSTEIQRDKGTVPKLEKESEHEQKPGAVEPLSGPVRKEFYKGPRAEEVLRRDSGSSAESEEESDSDEDSDSDEPRKKPVFISKAKQATGNNNNNTTTNAEDGSDRRHEETLRMIQQQVRMEESAEAAKFASVHDDEIAKIDDTDDVDPAAEYQAWKIRELKRIQREREQLEQAEKEAQELEERRNLTEKELDQEHQSKLQKERQTKQERPKMGYMQKYYHKGAFYQGEAGELENRNYAQRVEDDVVDKAALPKALQVRDRVGIKGRTKYRSLLDEDTTRPSKRHRKD